MSNQPTCSASGISLVREISPQLWVVLVITLFNSYKYLTMATVLSLFATNDYGLSDMEAGRLYGLWGLMHTMWGFVGSFMVDCFGIRTVAIVATTFGVISRGLLVFTNSVDMMKLVLILLGPLAEGICDPLYMVAIKKLTRRRIRPFAFATQYAFLSLGGAIGENLTDVLRAHSWRMPWGVEWSGLRFVLFTTWLAADMCWVLAWFIHEPKPKASALWPRALEVNAFNQPPLAGYVALLHPSPLTSPASSPRLSPAASPNDDTLDMSLLVKDPANMLSRSGVGAMLQCVKAEVAAYCEGGHFARAVLLTTAVMFVSLQWGYMDTLLPKYAERIFGFSCPWGTIYSVNSWMCVLCPPIISALTPGDRFDDFTLIVPGLWIMALSPLCIYFFTSEVALAGWVLFLTVGEVLWSPRSQSFIASTAPVGREGIFLALAGAPNFFVQYPVGIISGWLLDSYCPTCPSMHNEICQRDPSWRANPSRMWLWVAISSAASPVLVTGLLGYFRGGRVGGGAMQDDEDE